VLSGSDVYILRCEDMKSHSKKRLPETFKIRTSAKYACIRTYLATSVYSVAVKGLRFIKLAKMYLGPRARIDTS
jgi:hypothetical protein